MTMRRRASLTLMGLSVLLALATIAGCGGGDGEEANSGSAASEQEAPATNGELPASDGDGDGGGEVGAATDPCELLDRRQIASRLPGPASPQPDLGWSGGQCRWEVDSDEEPRVIVGLAPWREFGELTEGLNVSPEPLTGLADEALLHEGTVAPGTFSADGRTLYIRRGEQGIGIVWDRTPEPAPSAEEMRELAEEILAAL